MVRAKELAKEEEEEVGQVGVKAVESGEEWEVDVAMAALLQATRESAPRRRALWRPSAARCAPSRAAVCASG